MENDEGQEVLLNNQLKEQRTLNGRLLAGVGAENTANGLSAKGQVHRAGMVKGTCADANYIQRSKSVFRVADPL